MDFSLIRLIIFIALSMLTGAAANGKIWTLIDVFLKRAELEKEIISENEK